MITEVRSDEKNLRTAFSRNGFEEVLLMEETKIGQIGKGMRKHINKDWNIHIRFLTIHQNLIAIDAEVETHIDYLEHITADNWISVVYEVWEVIKEVTDKIHLFHKTTGLYVQNVLKNASVELKKLQNQIEWKPILAVVGLVALLALFLKAMDEE